MKTTFKLIILSIAISLIAIQGSAQEVKEIKWLSWKDAMIQQKKDIESYNGGDAISPPKKIFMDVYTDWCGWCKKMDASTFKDPIIVDIMNKYYYPVKFDAEMTDNIEFNGHTFVNPTPGGKRSTHQFAASILDYGLSYPSYVLLDENTNRLTIYKGYKQTEDLLGILLFFGKNQHLSYSKGLEKQFDQKAQQKSK